MKIFSLSVSAALALALSPWSGPVQAQGPAPASAPASASAASAPRVGKPPPKQLTPDQARESATAPGELRPERPVTPQVTIPLGRKPPEPVRLNPPPRGKAASSGGIDDSVARCEAQSDPQARARCRGKQASGPRGS